MSPTSRIRPAHPPRTALADLARAHGLRLTGPAAGAGEALGITLDNRGLAPGEIFAALPGAHTHGARFAAAAAAAGASAVLTDASGAAAAEAAGIPVLVADVDGSGDGAGRAEFREIVAAVAADVYGRPAERLRTFAVTGTNGKTTTSFLLAHLLGLLGRRVGLIGTVELRIGDAVVPARLTTPEAPDLHALLAHMVEAGVTDLVMEVSSHALELHRVDPVRFDLAAFTHLTQDHLDFHGDLEHYYAAKASLFTPARARRAVVSVDDEWGRRLAGDARAAGIDVATLATRGEHAAAAAWTVRDVVAGADAMSFTLTGPGDVALTTSLTMPGAFNVANAALALATAIEGGVPAADVVEALAAAGGLRVAVPGRMEVVGAEPRCVVDFAHNTDAVGIALAELRATTSGRLHVVLGATGERDRGKRPAMGEAAVLGADAVIVTDDDPHDEDPAQVRAEVLAGALRAAETARAAGRHVDVREVAPRSAAIAAAVAGAAPEDTVLVAGRGHETIQEVAGEELPLDDRVEVRAALARREGRHA
ncbi:UDP-N-acetylmuramyl-tripeptide synthetase [Beutenbergia cavernae DSM 12333]|uniref:UDP-N-acetylmuramyl-tripeptide synthetase n=1 Tax=Beutenbergia cavernae (strain ATCC BAA-8 / DSM 12333 / CCUG 43141 / JCM 11478 / NBRC 16432 / NCIMB 13614 / HKI 0122) TaxID=471853 RepID=C5BW64_BEUC1|nr:UDP-N-acetylmuramoyl-L-alanyl-D-glutamate--2,6-diaminopimelate ligase [Beutenbergia cavernae]ACQ80665.1 UDP-N-acetylmuramyl-tripeptide synthetase [Beutenbergia cavernae DSM 12333]